MSDRLSITRTVSVTADPPVVVNGWGWVTTRSDESPDALDRALRRLHWDGTYTAPCPCGRVITWHAYQHQPGPCECM